jgi:hypothetical protein
MVEQVEKRNAYGIKPRNAEQAFAIHAVLKPEIKLVSMQGVAGTGKDIDCPGGCSRTKTRIQTNLSGPAHCSAQQ